MRTYCAARPDLPPASALRSIPSATIPLAFESATESGKDTHAHHCRRAEQGLSQSDQLRIPSTIAAEGQQNVAEKGHSSSNRSISSRDRLCLAKSVGHYPPGGQNHHAMDWGGGADGEKLARRNQWPQRSTPRRSDPAFRRCAGDSAD